MKRLRRFLWALSLLLPGLATGEIKLHNVTVRNAGGLAQPLVSMRAANGKEFGLRADGRFYPYSTPQGRRSGARQEVWKKGLFQSGCTREEAERHFRSDLGKTFAAITAELAARQPAVDFAQLDGRQQETLLDLALTEGVPGRRPEFIATVLAGDWDRMIREQLYVRYADHAPGHARNKAFAQRWKIP